MPDQSTHHAADDPAPNSGADGVFRAGGGGVPEVGQGAGAVYDEEPGEAVPGSFLAALPQFFDFPLILVGSLTGVFLLITFLAGASDPSARELLVDIRTAGSSERWYLLHDLAQGLTKGRLELTEVAPDELMTFYTGTLLALEADPNPSARERDALRHALLLVVAHSGNTRFTPLALEALASDSADLRLGALQALAVLGDPASLPALRPFLESPEGRERLMALGAVASLEMPAARDVLAGQLRAEDPEIVRNAALQLGLAGDARATPVVLHLLDRASYGPDAGVSAALAQLGDDASRAGVRDRYVDELLVTACRAAAALGDPAFVPALRALRRADRSMKVKSAALDALHDMGVDPETS